MPNIEKVVLVTGSSRGIGRGIAIELSKRGYSVAINYAGNEQAAIETKTICQKSSVDAGFRSRFEIFQGDISSDSSCDNLLKNVLNYFGDIHALVNNAGIAPKERRDLLDMSPESFDSIINTNLRGAFFLSQKVSNYWLTQPKDDVVSRNLIFITSVSSEMPSINRGEYCMAKSGLSMATELFSVRLAPENIGVFEIRPGIIETSMTGAVKDKYDKEIENGLVPQKRWGQPEDIGKAVAVIVNGDLSFSTGSVIHVDGTLHINSF